MDYCVEIISHCDALLRSSAIEASIGYSQHESRGADLEEKFCRENGIPVFYAKGDLYDWCNRESAFYDGLELRKTDKTATVFSH